MAQLLNLPVRCRFIKVLATWEIRTVRGRGGATQFAFPKIVSAPAGHTLRLAELDGWSCREALFDLAEGDNEALLQFLTNVGVWSNHEVSNHWSAEVTVHCRQGNPVPIDVAGLWLFRDALRTALLDKKRFAGEYAPALTVPETDFQLAMQRGTEFPLRFEITRVASGVLTTTDCYQMLLATVFLDVARGIRFKMCARKDCGQPFPIESRHKRMFHSQYCGHLVSQRKKRARDKKQKDQRAR
jgi:uncharacterized protein YjhX (UPF0386 family)